MKTLYLICGLIVSFSITANSQTRLENQLLSRLTIADNTADSIEILNDLCTSAQKSNLLVAKKYATHAYKLAASVQQEPILQFETYYNSGYCTDLLGSFEQAITYYKEALRMAEKAKIIDQKIITLNRLGEVYLNKGTLSVALMLFHKAIELENKNRKSAIGLTNFNIGKLYYLKKSYEKSATYFQKASKQAQAVPSKSALCFSYLNMGYVHLSTKDYFSAIKEFEKALSIAQQNHNQLYEAEIYEAIGLVHFIEKRYEAAFRFTNSALKINHSLGIKRKIATYQNQIGKIYVDSKQSDKAIPVLSNTLHLAKEQKQDLELAEAHHFLYLAYIELEQLQKAHHHFQKYQSMEGMLLNVEEQELLASVEADFDAQQNVAVAATPDSKEANVLLVFMMFLIGLIGLGLFRKKMVRISV